MKISLAISGAMGFLIATGSAYCQSSFHLQPTQPLDSHTVLECIPNQLDRDPDPVYKIVITAIFDLGNDEAATDMTITHVTVSGARYSRSDQYTQSSLTKTPGKREWFWTGRWKKDASVVMKGELFRTAEGKWFYFEDKLGGGTRGGVTRSACHVECGGSASVPCNE